MADHPIPEPLAPCPNCGSAMSEEQRIELDQALDRLLLHFDDEDAGSQYRIAVRALVSYWLDPLRARDPKVAVREGRQWAIDLLRAWGDESKGDDHRAYHMCSIELREALERIEAEGEEP